MHRRVNSWIHAIVLLVTSIGTITSIRGVCAAESDATTAIFLVLAVGNPALAVHAGWRLWQANRSRRGSAEP